LLFRFTAIGPCPGRDFISDMTFFVKSDGFDVVYVDGRIFVQFPEGGVAVTVDGGSG
jgi:predicted metal-binding protein